MGSSSGNQLRLTVSNPWIREICGTASQSGLLNLHSRLSSDLNPPWALSDFLVHYRASCLEITRLISKHSLLNYSWLLLYSYMSSTHYPGLLDQPAVLGRA